jgi:POT family proton-dependent oligopeptide transporter
VLSAIGAVLLYLTFRLRSREDWKRVGAIFILALFTAIFWMGFEQAGGTLNLFAYEHTDRRIAIGSWQWEFPAPYFQSLNPLLIFLLAPLFSSMWVALGRRSREPSTPIKMALGLILLGGGFAVMSTAAHLAQWGKVAPLWLASVYLLHTLGELCLSPVGLSMVTRVAPASVAALMMGVWFLSSAFGNYMAGVSEALLEKMHLPLYPVLTGISLIAGVVLLFLARPLSRWMHTGAK